MNCTVSVITVAYNSESALREFWAGTEPRSYDWIVVDNASSDASAAVARERGARVVRMEANRGFSAANNIGAGTTDADVLVFCNPDVTVTEEGLALLAREVRRRGGIVAPQLVNVDGSMQENGRGMPFPARKVRHLLRLPDGRYCRYAGPEDLVDVPWVIGAVVAIGRDDFERLGRWDSGFFLYYEDADLCLRAWALGMPVRLLGAVRWVHGWARATGRGVSVRAWRHEVVSAARFYSRHPYCLVPLGRRWRMLRRLEHQRQPAPVAS